MDLIVGYLDAIDEDEGEDGHDEPVEEEVGEHANSDGREDEEGIGAPFQAPWLIGVICCRHDCALYELIIDSQPAKSCGSGSGSGGGGEINRR